MNPGALSKKFQAKDGHCSVTLCCNLLCDLLASNHSLVTRDRLRGTESSVRPKFRDDQARSACRRRRFFPPLSPLVFKRQKSIGGINSHRKNGLAPRRTNTDTFLRACRVARGNNCKIQGHISFKRRAAHPTHCSGPTPPIKGSS